MHNRAKQAQDNTVYFERYLLCDFTQNATRKTFIINFESLELPSEAIASNNYAARLTLFGNTSLVPVKKNEDVNLYQGNRNLFDSMSAEQRTALNQVHGKQYYLKRVICATGNTLSLTNGNDGEEYECHIPNRLAWEKDVWLSLLQKCNQSLMESSESGTIPTELLKQHLQDVFGELVFVEASKCACENVQRVISGTFGCSP